MKDLTQEMVIENGLLPDLVTLFRCAKEARGRCRRAGEATSPQPKLLQEIARYNKDIESIIAKVERIITRQKDLFHEDQNKDTVLDATNAPINYLQHMQKLNLPQEEKMPWQYYHAPHVIVTSTGISLCPRLYAYVATMTITLHTHGEDAHAPLFIGKGAGMSLVKNINRYYFDTETYIIKNIIADIRIRYQIPDEVLTFALVARTSNPDAYGAAELVNYKHYIRFKAQD